MKLIILTEEQAQRVAGRHGDHSMLRPTKVFRLKTEKSVDEEIVEYILPVEVLDRKDLDESIINTLNGLPVVDVNYYYMYEEDTETNQIKKVDL